MKINYSVTKRTTTLEDLKIGDLFVYGEKTLEEIKRDNSSIMLVRKPAPQEPLSETPGAIFVINVLTGTSDSWSSGTSHTVTKLNGTLTIEVEK